MWRLWRICVVSYVQQSAQRPKYPALVVIHDSELLDQLIPINMALEENWQRRATKQKLVRNILFEIQNIRYLVELPSYSALSPLQTNTFKSMSKKQRSFLYKKSFVQAGSLPARWLLRVCRHHLMPNVRRLKPPNQFGAVSLYDERLCYREVHAESLAQCINDSMKNYEDNVSHVYGPTVCRWF